MINFFRQIRQNLLSEGKTAKYLKLQPVSYASTFEAANSSGTFEKFRNKRILKTITKQGYFKMLILWL